MKTALLSLRSAGIALLSISLGANAQTWVQKADCPGPGRYWGAATGNSTKGYAGTGILSFELFTSQQQDMYEYDPATDSWTQLENYPGGVREGMCAFTIGERIFFAFGTPFIGGSTLMYEYLPDLHQWQQRNSCPLGSSQSKGFVIGDNYYIGPLDFDGLMYRYTATTDSWALSAPFPGTYRTYPMTFTAGGKGYMGGGGGTQGSTDNWYSYDPGTDAWTSVAVLSPNSDQSSGTTINGVGYVYNVGGNGSAVYRYDPVADGWNFVASYGDIRTANGSFFTIGNKGYHVFGQQQQSGGLVSMSALWEFTPGGNTAVEEHAVAGPKTLTAADGSIHLVGGAPLAEGTTLQILDVAGRLLETRTLAAGAVVNERLSAKDLGAGLRIVALRGARPWTGRVVLAD